MFSVKIVSKNIEDMKELDKFNLDLRRRSAYQEEKGQYVVPAILNKEQIEQIKQAGYAVEILSDIKKIACERVHEISNYNRFIEEDAPLEFAELTTQGYMTADEVEASLINLSSKYPNIVTIIQLPNRTWEGRISHAVRLRAGTKQDRIGVLFTGSVHAREWGGSDICVNFIVNLLECYKNHNSLIYGNKKYSEEEVRTILENLDVFVFPDVNPDGKEYSQKHNFLWRKNRNPNGSTDEKFMGVDINRNFDFLWNSGIGTSANRSENIYRGTAPFAEPETKNVKYLFDTYPNIEFYMDIHSYSGLILYNWGDDSNQSSDSNQNFQNHTYDGKRGIPNDGVYGEFIPEPDQRIEVTIADRINKALSAVRGSHYKVQQAVGLYPTSATSDDYAFSRHIVDPSKKKVYSFVIEFGEREEDGFVPPFTEMQNIIKDVDAALTEFCLAATSSVISRELVGSST